MATDRDTSITRSRSEVKYRLSASEASRIRDATAGNMNCHTYTDGRITTFVTSIYFDTAEQSYYRHAVAHPRDNIKVRAREYYYFNEELIELSSSYESLFEYSPSIWLEVKQRRDQNTLKHRLKVPKKRLVAFLEGEDCDEAIRVANEDADIDGVVSMLRSRLLDEKTPLLGPLVAVNYRRTAFENEASSLRITFDAGLSVHPVRPELFLMEKPLIKENLSAPLYIHRDVIVEVKATGQIPGWLQRELSLHAPTGFSKFIESSRLVADRGEDREIQR